MLNHQIQPLGTNGVRMSKRVMGGGGNPLLPNSSAICRITALSAGILQKLLIVSKHSLLHLKADIVSYNIL